MCVCRGLTFTRFIPNLVICEVITRDKNRVRLLQVFSSKFGLFISGFVLVINCLGETETEIKMLGLQKGCKCLLYMVLHARVVLDLWERPRYEILFQQVEGDFDSFQGKWTLEPLGAQHTLLKYVVDTRMHKDSLLAEALVEEVRDQLLKYSV